MPVQQSRNSVSIANGVTAMVPSAGNYEALKLLLGSILAGTLLPEKIHLRLEGDCLRLDDFYFSQLIELARVRRVNVELSFRRSEGHIAARQWQFDACATNLMWSLDDDVVVDSLCLESLMKANNYFNGNVAFLQGQKPDISNRRGYPHFDPREKTFADDGEDLPNPTALWAPSELKEWPIVNIDPGNVLYRLNLCAWPRFGHTGTPVLNSSGDDTIFALACAKAGIKGMFVPSAIAFHLEKPSGGFNEATARGNYIALSAALNGYDHSLLRKIYMPGIWPRV